MRFVALLMTTLPIYDLGFAVRLRTQLVHNRTLGYREFCQAGTPRAPNEMMGYR